MGVLRPAKDGGPDHKVAEQQEHRATGGGGRVPGTAWGLVGWSVGSQGPWRIGRSAEGIPGVCQPLPCALLLMSARRCSVATSRSLAAEVACIPRVTNLLHRTLQLVFSLGWSMATSRSSSEHLDLGVVALTTKPPTGRAWGVFHRGSCAGEVPTRAAAVPLCWA